MKGEGKSDNGIRTWGNMDLDVRNKYLRVSDKLLRIKLLANTNLCL